MRLDESTSLLFVDCKTSVEVGVAVEASCVGDRRMFGRGTEKASMPRINHDTMAKAVVVA